MVITVLLPLLEFLYLGLTFIINQEVKLEFYISEYATMPVWNLDALVIAPCTGNTLAKLSGGIADTPVTLAAKAHLRNNRPIVVAVSTNDALAGAAANIGRLLATKNYFFVPMGQDDPQNKPTSVVADFTKIPLTLEAALQGEQIQPILSVS